MGPTSNRSVPSRTKKGLDTQSFFGETRRRRRDHSLPALPQPTPYAIDMADVATEIGTEEIDVDLTVPQLGIASGLPLHLCWLEPVPTWACAGAC